MSAGIDTMISCHGDGLAMREGLGVLDALEIQCVKNVRSVP